MPRTLKLYGVERLHGHGGLIQPPVYLKETAVENAKNLRDRTKTGVRVVEFLLSGMHLDLPSEDSPFSESGWDEILGGPCETKEEAEGLLRYYQSLDKELHN